MDLIIESLPFLLVGAGYTIQVSLFAVVLGLICGWTFGLFSVTHSWPLRLVARAYVEFIRGTPLLVQILLAYFGLASLGIQLPVFWAGVLALGLNAGGFQAEAVRAGIESIDLGQTEAAKTIGLSRPATVWFVLAPQAVLRVIPPITNEMINLVKGSSLLAVIGAAELTHSGDLIVARTFKAFPIYMAVAAIYLVMLTTLSQVSKYIERWLPRY